MDAYLCDIRRDVLIRNLIFLRDTLVYRYIKAPLISYGIIPESVQIEIENSEFNAEKIERLLLYLSNRAPHRIKPFLDLLSNPRHGYGYVYNHLKDEERDCLGQQRVLNASSIQVNNSFRNRNEIYRHTLMRYSHQNREEDFRKLQSLGLSKWAEHSDDLSSMSADRKRNLADLYFLAVDAEIARRRIKYDTKLCSRDWFSEMKNIIPYTANTTQTTMMYLARYGSALSLNGYPHEICVTYLDLALQLSFSIPTCRETGMVLYIYFNMLSKEYEKRPAPDMKNKLITMAKQAIDHFENDNEETGRDYKRFLVLKMAMLLLGVGMIGGESVKNKICREDMCVARHCLQSIQKPEMWERMEVRRKMFYFLAYSKYQETSNDKHLAIEYIRKAKSFAVSGEFNEEQRNIDNKINTYQQENNTCNIIIMAALTLLLYTLYSLIFR